MVLLFIVNLTIADNNIKNETKVETKELSSIDLLKPTLPTEATFEDDTINIYLLRPIIPIQATFEE